LSKKIGSWHWHSGPGDLCQKYVTPSPLWHHPQKKQSKTSQPFKIWTERPLASLEGWAAV